MFYITNPAVNLANLAPHADHTNHTNHVNDADHLNRADLYILKEPGEMKLFSKQQRWTFFLNNKEYAQVVKNTVIVIDMVSVQNLLEPFCCVLG